MVSQPSTIDIQETLRIIGQLLIVFLKEIYLLLSSVLKIRDMIIVSLICTSYLHFKYLKLNIA